MLPAVVESAPEGQGDMLGRSALFDVIPGAAADGQGGTVRVAGSGDDDHRRSAGQSIDPGEQGKPVAVRQTHIQKDRIHRLGLRRRGALGQCPAGYGLVAHAVDDP